ncbi:hypothetical protein BGZ80_009751 [Entomortierella chlamydospora]|uniref:Ornithine cyclodeaminase mu-crystallin family protein n=1 Tax=Entomortierella chlamydospora TaxID=101097 RepID=A0A9P6MWE8_9FUNG|nr:hypothetical protein BGZ80_009751 [Entomortierella chlamydospora]
MPPVRVVSLEHVAAILKAIDLEDVLVSQAKAFHAYSAKVTQTPNRITLGTPAHSTLIMPSRIDTLTSAIKIVSVPKTDSKNGLPGVTLVLDNETAEPRGLVNARLLTAVRTAAGSALATRAIFNNNNSLMKAGDSLTLVVFGAGAQAKSHVQLLLHVLPQIRKVVICNRTLPRAQELVKDLGSQSQYAGVEIVAFCISTGESTGPISSSQISGQQPKEQLKHIVQIADVICTCTNSREALFPGEWETGQDSILAELGQIFDEHGQLSHAALPPEFITVTKSDVTPTDVNRKDVTIFKSVGIAAQDVAITALVLDKAEEMNLGAVVDF